MRAILADITSLEIDAIVNAANESLLGGGGVDGAIHRAAGPGLLEECRRLGGCRVGEAKLTGAYALKAKCIIHTVGPIWRGGASGEAQSLAGCYRSCLELARTRALASIAFPAISTGVYGYPVEAAARIAVATAGEWLKLNSSSMDISFCCYSKRDLAIYESVLAAQRG
jgi:O-acetyl-ADP-ribose deacetylase (regulator of RNase III)